VSATTDLVRGTFRGLAQPKRLVPILVVSAPLVFAQAWYSRRGLAVTTAVLTCVAFVLIAPLAFRLLFPEEERTPLLALRIAVYAALAVVVNLTLEVFLPRALGVGRTFLSERVSVAVSLALFVVGGWGLGRDIGFEASLAAERARAAAFAKEAEAAQLLALRSHFDPHFLFNTLNAIAEWCREDGETAEKAILALSSMLREVLQGVRAPTWPLERELGLLDALFSLHGIRDPLAFTVLREIEPGVSALPIVPLLLLPLAENAVKHGPAAGRRGVIRVSARATDDTLAIEIENPGRYAGPRPGSDGLPLVQRRLAAAYGDKGRLAIARAPDDADRTRVSVAIPSRGPSPGVSV
jgi:two-component system, LytTR family, sensor histidine kinase AlgZ